MFSAARWRLTIVFTTVLVAILAFAGVVVYLTTESLIYDRVDAELSDKAHRDQDLVTDDHKAGEGNSGHGGPDEPKEFDPGGYSYAIVEPDGTVEESSGTLTDQPLRGSTIESALSDGHAVTELNAGDDTQRVYVLAVDSDDGTQLLAIARSIESEQAALSELRTILLIVVLGSIVPALAGGYLLSGRALRPIKQAIESQQAFIADASHELRTPVAVVRTNAELLERHIESGRLGQIPNDTRAVQDIISEADRMGRLVGQMLTLAQADAGQAIVSQKVLRLDELAEEAGRSMSTLAEARGVELTVQAARGVWVKGDRDRLREVMVTLLDNAIKYTESGGRVQMKLARSNRKANLTVSDTGQGIAPAELGNIFKRFYRADKARSREEGGTGLGLAIAHHIVEAHGGDIRIESEPGRGTLITVELRLLARESVPETTRLPEASG